MDREQKSGIIIKGLLLLVVIIIGLLVYVRVIEGTEQLDYCHSQGYDGVVDVSSNGLNPPQRVCYKDLYFNEEIGKSDRIYGEIK